ncbi:MAG: PhoU domain-containing protein [Promethearchaeota archaeon]
MEIRKVQQTGGSSFIVSLPKEWIVKHGVQKNDSLGIISQPDGNLLVTPDPNSQETLKIKEIDVDEIKDYNYLFRLLIGTYIMGFNEINVISSKKIERFVRECVASFTKIVIGPEIFEETNNKIRIKDLLNPKEMPFETTIRRMYILVEGMHEDAITALKEGNKEKAEDIVQRDNEIDRLHWLIGRQTHIVLRDIILCQKMNITLEDAVHFQQVSRLLERIGDHAVKIATNVIYLIDYNISKVVIEKITKASKISMKLLEKSLDSWLQKDIILANDNIESIQELIDACEEITGNFNNKDVESFVFIDNVLESVRRTGEYAGDISEIIINNLLNE